MPLVVHHLGSSQSERIVWLVEELGIPYELRLYKRAPLLAPPELKNLPGNVLGAAPVIQDGDEAAPITLGESGAIVEYILGRHGRGSSLAVPPEAPHYPDYLYWLHAANGSLQPMLLRTLVFEQVGIPRDHLLRKRFDERLWSLFTAMDARLRETGAFLAGPDVTAADCMTVFCLTTVRYWFPFSLAEYPHIVAYLKRVGERPAYRRAMEKAEPDMELVLGADPPAKSFFEIHNVKL